MEQLTTRWNELPPTAQAALLFGLLILGSWFFERIILWIVNTRFRRLAQLTTNRWDDLIIDSLNPTLRYLTWGVILRVGADILHLNATQTRLIDRIIQTLILIALGLLVYRLVSRLTQDERWFTRLLNTPIDPQLLPFVRTGLRVLVLAISFMMVIDVWGYSIDGLVAGLGLGGLAIALAAQDTFSNLFGFTAIVGDQPFVVGDYIKTTDAQGKVERVGARTTRIRQDDQSLVSIPNSRLTNNPITNWSRLSKREINLTLGLPYAMSSQQMRTLLASLRQLLASRPQVEANSIEVFFTDLGTESLKVSVSCYLRIREGQVFLAEKEAILLAIMDLVAAQGLTLGNPS